MAVASGDIQSLRLLFFLNAAHSGLGLGTGLFLLVELFQNKESSFGVERDVVTTMMVLSLVLEIGAISAHHQILRYMALRRELLETSKLVISPPMGQSLQWEPPNTQTTHPVSVTDVVNMYM